VGDLRTMLNLTHFSQILLRTLLEPLEQFLQRLNLNSKLTLLRFFPSPFELMLLVDLLMTQNHHSLYHFIHIPMTGGTPTKFDKID